MVERKKEIIIKKKGKKMFSVKGDELGKQFKEKLDEKLLINEIVQIGHNNFDKYGTLISFQNLYNELIKKFDNKIEVKRVKKILKKMHKEEVIKLIKINKFFKVIQFTPIELNPYIIQILKVASQNPMISCEELSYKINLNIMETQKLLNLLVSKNMAKTQENILSGKKYVFPGLIKKN